MIERTFAAVVNHRDITSQELDALCEGHKVKRATGKRSYRVELAGRTGNYARRLVKRELTKVKYCDGAYRADAKRAGNAPNLWGWVIPPVTRAAKKI